jgi:hypothetical protein
LPTFSSPQHDAFFVFCFLQSTQILLLLLLSFLLLFCRLAGRVGLQASRLEQSGELDRQAMEVSRARAQAEECQATADSLQRTLDARQDQLEAWQVGGTVTLLLLLSLII